MGNQCSNLQQATAADNKNQIKHQQNNDRCINLPCKSKCLNFGNQISSEEKIVIKPIQFIDNANDLEQYERQNQDIDMGLATTDRMFLKTIQSEYRSSFLNNKPGQTSHHQQALDQISTKKQQVSQQNYGKVIIKAKDAANIPQYYKDSNVDLNTLQIPFEIIKLSMSKNIIQALKNYYPEFFEKYDSQNSPRAAHWRMLQNGTYINILANLHGVFITKDLFYEGFFANDQKNSHIPDQKGLLINNIYVYEGQLKMGRPSGEGRLIIRDSQQIYSGIWLDGSFTEGIYEKQDFKYDGGFFNNEASGEGQLHIKNRKIKYKGNFSEGYFYDQNAKYVCQKYSYEGGFVGGKKNGKGILIDKNNKVYEGKWSNDRIFINTVI